MTRIAEVLPDVRNELWIMVADQVFRVRVHPQASDHLLALAQPQVFRRVQVTADGAALRWPGGAHLSVQALCTFEDTPQLTSLGVVPPGDRYRPLLPVLRYGVPPAPSPAQPTRLQLVRLFGLKEGELTSILGAYPVPEAVMLHRLHDIGLFLRTHLYGELPVAVLRRPWVYAAHRCPHQPYLHTMMACLMHGRIDLVEEPLWALACAELA